MKRIFIGVLVLLMFVSFGYGQVSNRPASGSLKAAKKVIVYSNGKGGPFAPSGWMGDTGAIAVDPNCTTKPRNGKSCMKWTYDISKSAKNGWAGVYWQYPANNWGSKKGLDLTGHRKLTFWVRGETGKEIIDITLGGMKGAEPDSFMRELKGIRLPSEWRQYVIDLSGRNLSNVVGGFCWTVDSKQNTGVVTFYFGDIIYE